MTPETMTGAKKARHNNGNLFVAYPNRPQLGMLARKTLLPKVKPVPGVSAPGMKAIERRRQTTLTSLVR